MIYLLTDGSQVTKNCSACGNTDDDADNERNNQEAEEGPGKASACDVVIIE